MVLRRSIDAEEIEIPEGVQELGDECFSWCMDLSRVTFGKLSLLKRIGVKAFYFCGMSEIRIPDSVEETGDMCFFECKHLSRVVFGVSSLLKDLGHEIFLSCSLREIWVPANLFQDFSKYPIGNAKIQIAEADPSE